MIKKTKLKNSFLFIASLKKVTQHHTNNWHYKITKTNVDNPFGYAA